jgi:hypothetical protein
MFSVFHLPILLPRRELLWIETEYAVAVPDAYPVSEGRTFVVPSTRVITILSSVIEMLEPLWLCCCVL